MARPILLACLLVVALTRGAMADFNGLLALARTGDLGGVRAMLEEGVDPNPPAGYTGYAPLMFAAGNGDPDMTRLLLEHGANTEYKDHSGERALLWAAGQSSMSASADNAQCVRLLLEAGSPADSEDDPYGRSALILASTYGGDAGIVGHLLAAGADVDRTDHVGETALLRAVRSRDRLDVVRLLLEKGADPNLPVYHSNETPLHHAALFAGPQTIRLLLAAGAEIEARQQQGETALFVAAGRGYRDNVEALLAAGAEIDAPSGDGRTPILAAITGRYVTDGSHADAALYLAGHTGDIDRAFAAALWEGHPQVAEKLLVRGADVDALDHRQWPVLAAAAIQPGLEWLDRLAASGADISRFGGEAIGVAASRGRDDSVARLIELGVSVSGEPGGAHALFRAAVAGHVSTVALLLDHGARLDAAAEPPKVEGLERTTLVDAMQFARFQLEYEIDRAERSAAYRDVSAQREELARLEVAHARIAEMLGL